MRDVRMREANRAEVERASSGAKEQPDDDRAPGASGVGVAARPEARDERRRELDARGEANHDRTEPKLLMHVERQHRHRHADDEVRDQH